MAVYRGNFAFDRFTIVPNSWVRDKRLNMADKGLLAYILSHSPEYPLTVEQIIGESRDGSDAVSSAMKRLEKVGYLRRQRQRDSSTGRLGPYDWYLQEPADQSGNPATGDDLQQQDVSAGHAQSGIPTGGNTSLVKVGTKKTTTKNTIQENQEPSSSRASSSSSPRVPKPRTTKPEDDEDARNRKIQNRKLREHRAAVAAIISRVGTDQVAAEMTVAYLHQFAEDNDKTIGNIEAYVKGCDDADLQEHHDSATWELDGWRDSARGLVEQVARNHPAATAESLDLVAEAFVAARRAGHSSDAAYEALNATHAAGPADPLGAYVEALGALAAAA